MSEYIVVEFSLSQKAFNKTTMGELCDKNTGNIMKRKQTDYLPIAFFKTDVDADAFISEFSHLVTDYSMYQNTNGKQIVF